MHEVDVRGVRTFCQTPEAGDDFLGVTPRVGENETLPVLGRLICGAQEVVLTVDQPVRHRGIGFATCLCVGWPSGHPLALVGVMARLVRTTLPLRLHGEVVNEKEDRSATLFGNHLHAAARGSI